MAAPKDFERFASRTHAALFKVFEALTNAFEYICLRCDIQEALIGFGILNDRFGFSVDRENERLFRLLEMFHEFGRIAPEGCHRLDIFFKVEHGGLFRNRSTFKGAKEDRGVNHRLRETKPQTEDHPRVKERPPADAGI